MTAIDEADKLAPCPFCGSDAAWVASANEAATAFWVKCDDCGSTGRWERSTDEAIAAWNTRPPEAAAQALRERGWTVVEPQGETLAEGVG